MAGIGLANDSVGSHEFVNANQQVQSDAFIVEEQQQANAHTMEKQKQQTLVVFNLHTS